MNTKKEKIGKRKKEKRKDKLKKKIGKKKRFPMQGEVKKAKKSIIQKIREKPFRIGSMGIRDKLDHKKEMNKITKKLNTEVETVNIVHRTADGNIHLKPGYKYLNHLHYRADRKFTKNLNTNDKISVVFPDGHIEEGYECDEYGAYNYRLRSKADKKATHNAAEYQFALEQLQDGTLLDIERKSSAGESRAKKMMLVSGIGIGVIFAFILGLTTLFMFSIIT